MQHQYLPQLELLYDRYSSMLFGLITELIPARKDAERLLALTFRKIYEQELYKQPSTCLLPALFQVTVKVCCEYLRKNPPPSLKGYAAYPLLLGALMEQSSLDSHAEKYGLSKVEVTSMLKSEFDQLRFAQAQRA